MVLIQTERLRLRTWDAGDLDRFAEINADPDVMQFFPAPLSREETAAMIQRLQAHQEEHGFCFWAVDHLSDNRLIGMIGLSRPVMKTWFTPCVEIGWRLHPSVWHQGMATEGAKACLAYAWETLGLDEVVSFTATTNFASQGVMKKIGMQEAGYFDHPLLPAGHPLQQHVLFRARREDVLPT